MVLLGVSGIAGVAVPARGAPPAAAAQVQRTAPLRIGIVGLTHDHAWRILDDLAQRADVDVVGISETVPELRQRARTALRRDVPFYDNFTRLLDEAKPQALLCFGDNREHVAVVRAAAARKVHVMMEKPLAPTFAAARAAYNVARAAGIKLMVNYWVAWTPTFQAAQQRVEAGDIGRVFRIDVRFGHIGPIELGVSPHFAEWLNDEQRNGGGAIIDFGCYGANLMRWILGSKPERVSAVRRTLKPQTYKVDDDAVIVASYPTAVGIVEASWNWPRDFTEMQVFGDKGELFCTRDSLRIIRGNQALDVKPAPLPPDRQGPIAFFLDAIRNDRPIEGLVGAEFNLDVSEILQAAKISAQSGRAVSLPLAAGGGAARRTPPAAAPGGKP